MGVAERTPRRRVGRGPVAASATERSTPTTWRPSSVSAVAMAPVPTPTSSTVPGARRGVEAGGDVARPLHPAPGVVVAIGDPIERDRVQPHPDSVAHEAVVIDRGRTQPTARPPRWRNRPPRPRPGAAGSRREGAHEPLELGRVGDDPHGDDPVAIDATTSAPSRRAYVHQHARLAVQLAGGTNGSSPSRPRGCARNRAARAATDAPDASRRARGRRRRSSPRCPATGAASRPRRRRRAPTARKRWATSLGVGPVGRRPADRDGDVAGGPGAAPAGRRPRCDRRRRRPSRYG